MVSNQVYFFDYCNHIFHRRCLQHPWYKQCATCMQENKSKPLHYGEIRKEVYLTSKQRKLLKIISDLLHALNPCINDDYWEAEIEANYDKTLKDYKVFSLRKQQV